MWKAFLVAFLSNLPVVFLENKERKVGGKHLSVFVSLLGIVSSEIQAKTFH